MTGFHVIPIQAHSSLVSSLLWDTVIGRFLHQCLFVILVLTFKQPDMNPKGSTICFLLVFKTSEFFRNWYRTPKTALTGWINVLPLPLLCSGFFGELLMLVCQTFTMSDLVMLLHGQHQPLGRIQPQLFQFFTQNYLNGREPSDENISVSTSLLSDSVLAYTCRWSSQFNYSDFKDNFCFCSCLWFHLGCCQQLGQWAGGIHHRELCKFLISTFNRE